MSAGVWALYSTDRSTDERIISMLDDKIEAIVQAIITELKHEKKKGAAPPSEPVQNGIAKHKPEQNAAGEMKVGLFCTGDHRINQS